MVYDGNHGFLLNYITTNEESIWEESWDGKYLENLQWTDGSEFLEEEKQRAKGGSPKEK